ncbi:glycoside hydrolase superfamily [Mycena galopus ATCC 62051]|nr:glycoside hydrolase superfamily [Mycena galopus ATCC 62051]
MPTLSSCSPSSTARQIGHYEGWATQRTSSCNPVMPAQLDLTDLTHVHYALATISQTFQIQITSNDTVPLQALVKRKQDNNELKVLISVGGWGFSSGRRQHERSLHRHDLHSPNRATFISPVAAFLKHYNFDGTEIDFGNIQAQSRETHPLQANTPNLSAFFSEMKAGLSGAFISVATPAGYWSLQGFEINKIASSASYISMMSYDCHGQWDVNVTGPTPVTNPHSSILDMRDSILLYTRVAIDMSTGGSHFEADEVLTLSRYLVLVVNLGLAWYARTYHLAFSSCKGYNCTMTRGGAPGPCTQAQGILAQFEVDQLIASGNKILDTASQTYWRAIWSHSTRQIPLRKLLRALSFTTDCPSVTASTYFGGSFVWSSTQATPTSPPPPTQTYPTLVTCTSLFSVAQKRVNAMMNDDQQRLNGFDTYFDMWNQQQLYPVPDGGSGPNSNNLLNDIGSPSSYDNALWTAIVYFKLGDYKKDPNFYARFSVVPSADWPFSTIPEILCWHRGQVRTNGLAFERLGGSQYKQDVVNTWGWLLQSGLRGSDGIRSDGVSWDSGAGTCGVSGDLFSYNQGTIPAGLGLLYKITGATNDDYLTQAEFTLNAVLVNGTTFTKNGILYEPVCDPEFLSFFPTGIY